MRRLVQSLLTWIYLTFMSSDAMKEAVASYPGFVCQGFHTMREAESFLRNEEKKKRRKREEEKRQHEEERNREEGKARKRVDRYEESSAHEKGKNRAYY